MNLWPRTLRAPSTGHRERRTIVLSALLCPICFGASDAPMAQAMNWGVLTLLAITVLVLAAFGTFFMGLARRAGQPASTSAGVRERGAPPRLARGPAEAGPYGAPGLYGVAGPYRVGAGFSRPSHSLGDRSQ